MYVVLFFLSQSIFIFPLFWGMVTYANKFETKQKQQLTDRDKKKKLTATCTQLVQVVARFEVIFGINHDQGHPTRIQFKTT